MIHHNASIEATVRALSSGPHASPLAGAGYPLLLLLSNSDQGTLEPWKGSKGRSLNSWRFRHNDGRVIYFHGNPSTGGIEVRLTAWWSRSAPILNLTGEKQTIRWIRNGMPT